MSPSNSPEPVRVWVVGSAADCDIVVDRDIVSGHHCQLAQYENGFALEDLESTNGTFVNGQALPARSRRWVTPQDAITLGTTERLPWPVDLRKRVQHGTIALPKAPSSGQWDKIITIGRAPESHQVLDYPNVTWNHARLLQDHSGRLFIEDLGSTNGTYVGVSRERALPHLPTPVEPDEDVYFGSLKIPIAKLAGPKRLALGDASIDQFAMQGQKTVIGRDPSCDYPLTTRPYPGTTPSY
jgi:pSer/pThr/pTyr-binding forkhead associated (FHA) protein